MPVLRSVSYAKLKIKSFLKEVWKNAKNESGYSSVQSPKEDCFWDSGLWNPAYYLGAPKDLEQTVRHIRRQKYGALSPLSNRSQATLAAFAS